MKRPDSDAIEPRTTRPLGISLDRTTPRLELEVVREGGTLSGRKVVLDGDVLRIGSAPSNELVLNDPLVSRVHCQLRTHRKGWRVVDTGSLNGTRLAGVSIRDADLALPECRLELGDSVIVARATQPGPGPSQPGIAPTFGGLVGASAIMRRLFARIDRVAKADGDLLIEGESGTGKELIAAEVVRRSARRDKPVYIVDCGALRAQDASNELFGHTKGAFPGAEPRVGAFDAARGGVVLLDEIGDLPVDIQPLLLRALGEREFRVAGEAQPRKLDARVIATTNRRLEDEINQGRFREDLYFRLSVLRIDVPPLREHMEDIEVLVAAFLEELKAGDRTELLSRESLAQLARHTWPGNVRELRNFVERYVVADDVGLERPLRAERASEPASEIDITMSFRRSKERVLADFEVRYLKALLAWAGGNVSKASRQSGMDRMYLHRLLQRYGIVRGAPLD
ncbi:MAG: sigma 54-dependent Fis family transcriptional regulator [Polyangiaceae bacterium]|nr:sigma 54-dependent Fis family transcriptional regulator [Polyangiaceae bacterium]